jgi:hypothetical protein
LVSFSTEVVSQFFNRFLNYLHHLRYDFLLGGHHLRVKNIDPVSGLAKIRAGMLSEATRLGPMIVEKERELNHLFAGNKIDGASLASVLGEIARLQGELRITHLRAHLELRRVLSDAQVKKYDELRGYGSHNHKHN